MMTMSMDPSSMNRMLMQTGGGGGGVGGASMYHHQSPGLGRRSLDRQRYGLIGEGLNIYLTLPV